MSATIAVEALRVGMFVHLDLKWWAHPFALSSFRLTTAEQIAAIKALGIQRVRWSPEKSDAGTLDAPVAAAEESAQAPDTASETPQQQQWRQRREQLAQQLEAHRVCTRQYREAAASCKALGDLVLTDPDAARESATSLTGALLSKMMVDGELCIRVLTEAQADRATTHALNVAVISMLMGRVFGFSDSEMIDVGLGALLHDVGKLELPERVRMPDLQAAPAEQAAYREHVTRGVALGKRMGLSPGAMLVIAQHHEMADGSGFPQKLNVDRMTAAARIVALVNRYDNLCDPALPAHALTPHEALSLIFAQTRSKFDASMLNAFIRMMGVYPPGSVVQLTDDRLALVTHVNSSRPLKPRVLLFDPSVPVEEALQINLEQHPDLGVRRSLRPQQLQDDALQYLSPRQRVVYFFEPAPVSRSGHGHELAA
jgi:putative nucleotidyltransferase with HDIG domain